MTCDSRHGSFNGAADITIVQQPLRTLTVQSILVSNISEAQVTVTIDLDVNGAAYRLARFTLEQNGSAVLDGPILVRAAEAAGGAGGTADKIIGRLSGAASGSEPTFLAQWREA